MISDNWISFISFISALKSDVIGHVVEERIQLRFDALAPLIRLVVRATVEYECVTVGEKLSS